MKTNIIIKRFQLGYLIFIIFVRLGIIIVKAEYEDINLMVIKVGGAIITITFSIGLIAIILTLGGMVVSGAKIEIGFLCFPVNKCNVSPNTPTPDIEAPIAIAVASTLTAIVPTPNIIETAIVQTLTAIAPQITLTPQVAIIAIPTQRVKIDSIIVQANSQDPTIFSCPNTGTYELVFEDGAYSPWERGGQWRTRVYAYVNRDVLWEVNIHGYDSPSPVGTPSHDIAVIGHMEQEHNDTPEDAIARAQGDSDRIYCMAGQPVNFITMDEKGYYVGNSGSITIGIYSLGE